MGFGKPLHIVVFARRGQLAGQIRKDAEDVLPERLGRVGQLRRLLPLLQQPPQERVAPQPPLAWLRSKDDRDIPHHHSSPFKMPSK